MHKVIFCSLNLNEAFTDVHEQQTLVVFGVLNVFIRYFGELLVCMCRSINVLNEDEVKEKKGANYLPFLWNLFYIMHYMHNRHTQQFDVILPYNHRWVCEEVTLA